MANPNADRLDALMRICPRYVVVSSTDRQGSAGFVLLGNANEEDQVEYWHSGIFNCRPGIWKTEVRQKQEGPVINIEIPSQEVLLRWVGELDAATELNFAADLNAWKAWAAKMDENFGGKKGDDDETATAWDADVVWKAAQSYFDDGGICNVISADYLTRNAARDILGADAEDDEDELEIGYYLETLTLNDDPGWESEVPWDHDYTIGGVHFGQDAVGGPPRAATGERDGFVVAIKMFCEDEEREIGYVYPNQPGDLVF